MRKAVQVTTFFIVTIISSKVCYWELIPSIDSMHQGVCVVRQI